MKFLNNISELDGCDCDRIIKYDGINLTGYIDDKFKMQIISSASYDLQVQAFDLDGNLLGDISDDFFYTVQVGVNGDYYFNMVSMRLADILCETKCFYLEVKLFVNLESRFAITAFDKFTSCFKVENCCILADGISVTFDNTTTT